MVGGAWPVRPGASSPVCDRAIKKLLKARRGRSALLRRPSRARKILVTDVFDREAISNRRVLSGMA
jgi:hypothetical protein